MHWRDYMDSLSASNEGLIVDSAMRGLAAGLIIGAAPAWQLARVDAQSAFRTAGRTAGHSRLRNMLMGAQVALALMVLIATASHRQ